MRDHKFPLVGDDPQYAQEAEYCEGCEAEVSTEICICDSEVFQRWKENNG